jgi:glutathione S-transferase
MNRTLDLVSSFAASVARLGAGIAVGTPGARPEQPLVLYEFESCPYCRKVREALTVLDLDAEIRPCPKGGTRFREEVIARGGKAQFPYLVDANADTAIYESDDIVRHLFQRYGDGRVPALLAPGPVAAVTGTLASALRFGAGVRVRKSRAPAKPLELWSFEGSPFCRLVRETLCELELPYWLHNVGKGSVKREAFVERSGRMMVPWLVDPNHGVAMFESADIVEYLGQTYAFP